MYLQESPLSFSHGLYGRSDLEDLNEVARRVLEKSKKVAKFDYHLELQVRSSQKKPRQIRDLWLFFKKK